MPVRSEKITKLTIFSFVRSLVAISRRNVFGKLFHGGLVSNIWKRHSSSGAPLSLQAWYASSKTPAFDRGLPNFFERNQMIATRNRRVPMLISVPILPLRRASVPQYDPREANCRSERTTAQGPQERNGCISAYPDLVEDVTGETVLYWCGRPRISRPLVADNPGDWMLHWHVTDHQESGMMAVIRVS